MSYAVVEVEWTDSATKHGWNDMEAMPTAEDLPCHSVGYLIADDEDHIALAFGLGRDEFLCAQVIPRGMVQRVTRLREVE